MLVKGAPGISRHNVTTNPLPKDDATSHCKTGSSNTIVKSYESNIMTHISLVWAMVSRKRHSNTIRIQNKSRDAISFFCQEWDYSIRAFIKVRSQINVIEWLIYSQPAPHFHLIYMNNTSILNPGLIQLVDGQKIIWSVSDSQCCTRFASPTKYNMV